MLLEARHLGSLVRFYETELGLPVLSRDAATGRTVLDAGGTRLRHRAAPAHGRAAERHRAAPPAIAALDSAQVRLMNLQVPYRTMHRPDGTPWALFFQDPEGNSLGYCSPASEPAAWPTSLQGSGASELRGESGVTEFMVYGGIYGAWLSAAIPIGLGVDDAGSVGICVLLTSPLAVCAAHQYGKRARLAAGRRAPSASWATGPPGRESAGRCRATRIPRRS